MFDNIVTRIIYGCFAIGVGLLIGSVLTWLLRKAGVKITNKGTIFFVILGWFFILFSDYLNLGILISTIGGTLFIYHRFITIPNKEKGAEFERILVKAKSGLLNKDEAYTLFKKASHNEAKGLLSEAKYLYELIVKCNTPISVDAQSCLNNPLLKEIDTPNNS